MPMREQLIDEMNSAMKAGDRPRLSTLRLLIASVKNREIDLKRELNDEEIYKVIATMARQRRESIEQFKKGGRQDLVEKEEGELELLTGFLPAQLSREEVAALVKKTIEETGAAGMKDMGKVMKGLLPRVTGRADGKVVSDIVRELLSGE